MSIPAPFFAPPIQGARRQFGFYSPEPTTFKVIQPAAADPNRLELRPVVHNRWGHATLAGLEDDRLAVQATPGGSRDLATPIACAVAGFLLFGLVMH